MGWIWGAGTAESGCWRVDGVRRVWRCGRQPGEGKALPLSIESQRLRLRP